MTLHSISLKAITGSLLLALLFASCAVTFVDTFRKDIADDLVAVDKASYLLFTTLMESTEVNDTSRKYANFEKQYLEIEVLLQSIHQRNSIRPNNKNSTAQSLAVLEQWKKYKEKHRKDGQGISDGVLLMQRTFISDQIAAILQGEYFKEKKISAKPETNN